MGTTSTDTNHAADSVQVLITFTHNPGNVNQVGVDERGLTCSGSATPSVTVSTVSAGGNTNTESATAVCATTTLVCASASRVTLVMTAATRMHWLCKQMFCVSDQLICCNVVIASSNK